MIISPWVLLCHFCLRILRRLLLFFPLMPTLWLCLPWYIRKLLLWTWSLYIKKWIEFHSFGTELQHKICWCNMTSRSLNGMLLVKNIEKTQVWPTPTVLMHMALLFLICWFKFWEARRRFLRQIANSLKIADGWALSWCSWAPVRCYSDQVCKAAFCSASWVHQA